MRASQSQSTGAKQEAVLDGPQERRQSIGRTGMIAANTPCHERCLLAKQSVERGVGDGTSKSWSLGASDLLPKLFPMSLIQFRNESQLVIRAAGAPVYSDRCR